MRCLAWAVASTAATSARLQNHGEPRKLKVSFLILARLFSLAASHDGASRCTTCVRCASLFGLCLSIAAGGGIT